MDRFVCEINADHVVQRRVVCATAGVAMAVLGRIVYLKSVLKTQDINREDFLVVGSKGHRGLIVQVAALEAALKTHGIDPDNPAPSTESQYPNPQSSRLMPGQRPTPVSKWTSGAPTRRSTRRWPRRGPSAIVTWGYMPYPPRRLGPETTLCTRLAQFTQTPRNTLAERGLVRIRTVCVDEADARERDVTRCNNTSPSVEMAHADGQDDEAAIDVRHHLSFFCLEDDHGNT